MSNAVSLLVSRQPRREVGALPSVYLIEQTLLRKGMEQEASSFGAQKVAPAVRRNAEPNSGSVRAAALKR